MLRRRSVTPNVPATAVLPVVASTVNLFVATSKLPSTPVAPVTSNVLLKVVAPVTPNVLLKVVAPVALNVPVTLVFPAPNVPVVLRFSSPKLIVPFESVMLPSARVNVPTVDPDAAEDVPVTPNVPATAVLPVVASTVNLFVATSKLPSTPVAPVTSNVLLKVVAPVTPNVLLKVVAPVALNVPVTLVFPAPNVPVVLRFSSPKLIVPFESVMLPSARVNVPTVDPDAAEDVPVTPNVPATAVLPVVASTVNLFVATSKLPSTPVAPVTSNVLLKVVAPVTPNVLPNVVAPVTPNVLLKVVAPVALNVPVTLVFPAPNVPVVLRFSSPKLIVPFESVMLPSARVNVPTVDPDAAEDVPVTPNVPATAVLPVVASTVNLFVFDIETTVNARGACNVQACCSMS